MEGMLKSIMDRLSKLEKGKGKKNVVWDEDLEDNYEDTKWDEHDKAEYEQKKKIERMKVDNKKISERMEAMYMTLLLSQGVDDHLVVCNLFPHLFISSMVTNHFSSSPLYSSSPISLSHSFSIHPQLSISWRKKNIWITQLPFLLLLPFFLKQKSLELIKLNGNFDLIESLVFSVYISVKEWFWRCKKITQDHRSFVVSTPS